MLIYKIKKYLKYLSLKQGIKETGVIIPLIATKDGILLDGRTRNRIAREFGLEVPVIILPFEIEYKNPDDLIDLLDGERKR